jgi:hypothetical protein
MLFAYTNSLDPRASQLDLCIIPERIDPFSHPIKVSALQLTAHAVVRVSALEGIKVKQDQTDRGLIVEPISPAKIFLTPSQPDLPGIEVKSVKIIWYEDGNMRTYFFPLTGSGTWREWKPNEM